MKKRRTAAFLCMGLTLLMLMGCGAGSDIGSSANSMAAVEATKASFQQYAEGVNDGGIYEAADYERTSESSLTEEAAVGRKLIKTVSMNVETEEFDELVSKLKQRVGELGGYIEKSEMRGNAYYSDSRWADITIRVPSDKLEGFVNEVAQISNITWKSENVDDITLNYVDVESRKNALEIEQERLLALLEIAESVEDVIAIESRLSEVRYEMQSYASQLLVYDNQVDYSTIYLSISEVQRLTPQEKPGMLERIATGFADNLSGAAALIENVIVAVIVLIPYWGVMVALVLAVVFICKGISKLEKKKKGRKMDAAVSEKKETE